MCNNSNLGLKGKKTYVCCVYRAPNSNIEIFGNYLGEITAEMKQGNAFVCGDFSSKNFQEDFVMKRESRPLSVTC